MLSSSNIVEKIQKDLSFLVLKPNLVHYNSYFPSAEYFENLAADLTETLNKIPPNHFLESYENYLKHYRLGIYAEQLLKTYFEHSNRFQLLANNLQIIDNKKTLGEIDFLVFDSKENEIKHIELACKFYIQMGESIREWVGPNPMDNLEKKSEKITLQLQYSTEKHPVMEEIKSRFGKEIKKEAWIKGRLFGDEKKLPTQSSHIKCGGIIYEGVRDEWKPVNKIDWLNILSFSEEIKQNGATMLVNSRTDERAFYLSEKWLRHYQHSIF